MDEANERDLAATARRLRRFVTTLVAFAAALLLLERLGYAGAYRSDGPALPALLPASLRQLVFAAPAILYLVGLWQLRQSFAAIAGGALFGRSVVIALKRLGALLVAGAVVTIFVMPWLHRLLGDEYPRSIDFDVATLILAAIGIALVFFASLVERASAIQAELDEMF